MAGKGEDGGGGGLFHRKPKDKSKKDEPKTPKQSPPPPSPSLNNRDKSKSREGSTSLSTPRNSFGKKVPEEIHVDPFSDADDLDSPGGSNRSHTSSLNYNRLDSGMRTFRTKIISEIDHPILEVFVYQARALVNKDSFSFSDPYCKIALLDAAGKKLDEKKTDVVRNNLNPSWKNAQFNFQFNDELMKKFKHLRFEVWDKDPGKDDFLGRVLIPAEDVRRKVDLQWRVLERRKPTEKVGGGIQCSAVFRNNETGFGFIDVTCSAFDRALNLGLRAAVVQYGAKTGAMAVTKAEPAKPGIEAFPTEEDKNKHGDSPSKSPKSSEVQVPKTPAHNTPKIDTSSTSSLISPLSPKSPKVEATPSKLARSESENIDRRQRHQSKEQDEKEEEKIAKNLEDSIIHHWDFKSTGSFYFTDHARKTFAAVRSVFNFSKGEMVSSLCNHPIIPLGKQSGKSGAGFYSSYDRRLFLKTLRKDEFEMLFSFLPEYHAFCQANPTTRLPRFYACYTIRMEDQKPISFIVMNNVFETSLVIHAKFDLKGSREGRHVSPEERKAYEEKKASDVVLKDVDFELSETHIPLKTKAREALLSAIEKDTHFLEEHGLMDYSLLVGIHHSSRDSSPELEGLEGRDDVEPLTLSTSEIDLSSSATSISLSSSTQKMSVSISEFETTTPESSGHSLSTPSSSSSSDSPTSSTSSSIHHDSSSSSSSSHTSSLLPIPTPTSSASAPSSPTKSPAKKPNRPSGFGKLLSSRFLRHKSSTHEQTTTPADDLPTEPQTEIVDITEVDKEIASVWQGRTRRKGGPNLEGNALSGTNGDTFFIGIIDILQRYTAKKKMETLIKGIPFDKDEISCVPPDKYAKRFRDFMTKHIELGE